MSITGKCKIEGCTFLGLFSKKTNKRHFVKGLCAAHYMRQRRGEDIYRPSIRDKRPAIIEGDIAKIPLGKLAKDGYAIVDADMAWLADKYKWCKGGGGGYAVTRTKDSSKLMHKIIITDVKAGYEIDHKNRNGLDNRLCNLRVVTSRNNKLNTGIRSTNKSGFKGVMYSSFNNKWLARITHHYKDIRIGYYDSKVEAALAYNKEAKKLHGEFAYENKV